jgi:hypothetical protein
MPLNSALVDAGVREQWQEVPLACPLTGEAHYVETVSAAAIEAAAGVDDESAAARQVLTRLRSAGHPVRRLDAAGECRSATDDDVMRHVAGVWRGLRDPANPDRRRLRLFGLLP